MEDLKEYKKIQYSNFEYEDEKYIEDGKKFLEEFKKNNPNAVNIKLTYEAIDNDPQTIDNPLTNTPAKSTFMLNSKKPEYYIRFGYLLDYIKKNILPRVKVGEDHDANPPIFKIDTDPWDNYMYSLPNQISLDPRVCIVRNSNFISGRGTVKVFHELWVFRPVDGKNSKSKNYNVAYPMNIYLNFNFVLESLQLDDRGDVNLFEFISNICTGLNKSLGGINNLEPIIDESSNTLKIIDTTPIPGLSENSSASSYMLQLYGYDKIGSNYIANFIRKVDLKTAITPEYATMITVGATAGGYVKGTEATAFSKWNVGLRDRFKEDFTPGNIESVKPDNGIDEAESNYVNRFLSGGYTSRYGFSDLPPHSFSLVDDIIEGNISIVTEYYKYLLSKEKSTSGGTIGFIPFKLSMTMDGLSGIKIYNKLNVNTEFLPKAYGKNMDLIITGVSHKLSNNDWETDLETTVIPKSGELSVVEIPPASLQKSIDNVAAVASSKSLREVLINAGYQASTFVFELALAIGSKEGYIKGSKNRPSRNNNPGNLTGTNYKDIDPGVTLEPANSKGERRFAKFTTPELGSKALVERKIKGWARGNYPGTIVTGDSKSSNEYRKQWNVPNSLKGIAGKKTQLTIEQFFYIYAPPSENNTEKYINSVVASLKKKYSNVTKITRIIDYINK
jgi:hypothetical protein